MSIYFKPDETKCPCCGANKMDPEFMILLDMVRKAYGPMRLTSAYRCEKHNADIGGQPDSMHLHGRAVDIVCLNQVNRLRLLRAALVLGINGIGIAKDFIHIDNRLAPGLCWLY